MPTPQGYSRPNLVAGWSSLSVVFWMLIAGLLSSAHAPGAYADVTPPQIFQFDVPASCTCAACSFEVYRTVKKYEGVSKVALSPRDHRLDVTFTESKHTVSDLAKLIARLDMGKDSTLRWALPNGVEAQQAVSALTKIPGVHQAKLDAKTRIVHLSFETAKYATAVTAPQLANALQGGPHAAP